MTITITHTHAEGTIVDGDPRPHHQVLKDAGFRFSRNINGGAWYIRGSRDRDAQEHRITRAAAGLRTAGFEVEVSIDNSYRDPGEREADRAERTEDRAAALRSRSGRLAGEATARFGAAHQIQDMIPLGQPILVGHHSERRHRRDIASIDRNMGAGVEAHRASEDAARQADAAEARQEARESGPLIIRRIERLEADQRDIERKLTPCPTSGRKLKPEALEVEQLTCPRCFTTLTISEDLRVVEHGGATGEWKDRLTEQRGRNDDDLVYWRAQLELLKADGFHQWGPDDFQIGDRVDGDCTVVKVNRKTLTVACDVWAYIPGKHDTKPYDKVRSVTRDGQEVNPT